MPTAGYRASPRVVLARHPSFRQWHSGSNNSGFVRPPKREKAVNAIIHESICPPAGRKVGDARCPCGYTPPV